MACSNNKSENFPWTWDHPKIKAIIPFPYPPSFILFSDLPLYMLLFVCVDVHIPSVLAPIYNLYEKAARILQSATHTPLDLLKIKDIYVLSLSSLAYQYFQGDLPCCFSGLLKLVGDVNLYIVRNRECVMIPASPSVRSDLGLAVTVGRAWNLVPAEIRQSRTLGSCQETDEEFLIKGFLLNVSYGLFIIFSFLGCCFVGVVSSMTREF